MQGKLSAGRARKIKLSAGDRTLYVGLFMLLILAILAALAPVICAYGPYEQDLYAALKAPGEISGHPLGTDMLGRDYLSRLLYGARTDLLLMVAAEIIPFISGVTIGTAAGYFGGRFDCMVSLIEDTFIAFPYYLIVIVVAFLTGAGAKGIIITFAVVGWLVYARVSRAVCASLRESGWVQAARLLGYGNWRIIFFEILPNVLPQAIVILMSDMAQLLAMIVTLGYLGVGISAPTPDWGGMISEGQSLIGMAPWLSLLPGLITVYTGLALSMTGDGLAKRWKK